MKDDISGVAVFFILVALMTTLGTYWIQVSHFHYLPPAGASMILGIFFGGILTLIDGADALETFDDDIFFYGLLPPIVYAAAFNLDRKAFFENFNSILTFAWVGTVVSAMLFAFATYGMNALGWISDDIFDKTLLECLLYGSLISAIDPVSTLAVFADLQAKPMLFNMLFGEAILNDAVAVVLFEVFKDVHERDDTSFQAQTIPIIILIFFLVSISSLFIGIVFACLCALLLKRLQLNRVNNDAAITFSSPVFTWVILFLFAYLAYTVAVMTKMSGIMTLFITGIAHRHYCFYNIMPSSRIAFRHSMDAIAFICENFVFVNLGMQIFAADMHYEWGLILSAIPLCLLTRAANIFPLAWIINRNSDADQQIPFRMQLMQWGCGLRGAIAYALAVDMPTGGQDEARAFRDCTLLVCIFTTLVFGAATKPALEATDMRDIVDENEVNMKTLSIAHPEVKRGPNTQDIQNSRPNRLQKENRRKSLFIAERQASMMAEVDLEDSADLRKLLSSNNGFSKLLFELDEKYCIPFLRVEGWKEQEHTENTALLDGIQRPSWYAT